MKKLLLALALLWPFAVFAQQGLPVNSVPYAPGHGNTGWLAVGPCTNGQVLGWSGTPGVPGCSNTGSGSVMSVGLALPGSTFSVSGSPVTSTGTLTGAFINQNQNTFFAGPASGAAATPTWRALVNADIPVPTVSALGGVQANLPVSHQWINSINTAGVPQLSQPAFSDLSGTITPSQCPLPALATVGCVNAINPITSNWINSITTSGAPVLSQPTFNDIAGSLGVAQISPITNNTLISNISGGSASPAANGLSAIIDSAIGNTQGNILYRNASAWTVLAPGTNGQVLSTGGAAANPSWTTVSGTGTVTSVTCGTGLSPVTFTASGTCQLLSVADGTILSNISGGSAASSANSLSSVFDHDLGSTQGQIIMRGGSTWTILGPGTSGQFLKTQGGGANPVWAAPSSTSLSDTVSTTTWTPTDASGASLSLTVTDASYYKIGKLVTIIFNITYPSTASGLTATIGGLPVQPYTGLAGIDQSCYAIFTGIAANIGIRLSNSSTTLTFWNQAGPASYANSSLSTRNVVASCTYVSN